MNYLFHRRFHTCNSSYLSRQLVVEIAVSVARGFWTALSSFDRVANLLFRNLHTLCKHACHFALCLWAAGKFWCTVIVKGKVDQRALGAALNWSTPLARWVICRAACCFECKKTLAWSGLGDEFFRSTLEWERADEEGPNSGANHDRYLGVMFMLSTLGIWFL